MTNEQWKEVGRIFKRIHQVQLPPGGLPFTAEPKPLIRQSMPGGCVPLRPNICNRDKVRVTLRALLAPSWVVHQSTIHTAVTSLEKLAQMLKVRSFPTRHLSWGFMHARNLIRDREGHVFVIDWDEVMLAPKERDFIFIREPQADAFWEGYGRVEIDWMLLSYYLLGTGYSRCDRRYAKRVFQGQFGRRSQSGYRPVVS